MAATPLPRVEDMPAWRIRWVGYLTILRREWGRIIRIWGQTIVPPAVTAALYFIIFGSLIGRRIGDMGGFGYMQYITPGLIMMAVIRFGMELPRIATRARETKIGKLAARKTPSRAKIKIVMRSPMAKGG